MNRLAALATASLCSLLVACGPKDAAPPSEQPAPVEAPATDPAEEAAAPNAKACVKTGCSGSICAEEEQVSTCEFKPEYACYQQATCERQPDGQCGWTQTPELDACLANPPAA